MQYRIHIRYVVKVNTFLAYLMFKNISIDASYQFKN